MRWPAFVFVAVIVVALVHLVVSILARALSRVPAIAWPLVRVAAALVLVGFAGWLALASQHTAVPATCVVTQVTTEPLVTGELDVRVRVRWQAAGREFHLREPMSLAHEHGTANELVARHANERVPCYVSAARPGRIMFGDAARATREQWGKAAAIAVPAFGLVALAIVGWRRRSRTESRRTAVWLSSKGFAGVVGIGTVILGMVWKSWLLVGVGGAWMLWLFEREVESSNRAVTYLLDKLSLVATPGRDARVSVTMRGTREGAAIEVDETTQHHLHAIVELVGWPEGVSVRLVPDVVPDHGTGDRTFDARFAVEGPPERWRALLTHEMRAALAEVILAEASWIDGGRWHAVYEDDVADGRKIKRDIERALALAKLVTADTTATPHERVLAVARAEPDAAVRAGHYRWLVSAGYPPAAVALVAADDPDETIRTWIRDQVAPPDGAFR